MKSTQDSFNFKNAMLNRILGSRRLIMHGVRPGDMVLVTRALGLANGGFHMREALWKYTGAVPVMTKPRRVGGAANGSLRREMFPKPYPS